MLDVDGESRFRFSQYLIAAIQQFMQVCGSEHLGRYLGKRKGGKGKDKALADGVLGKPVFRPPKTVGYKGRVGSRGR